MVASTYARQHLCSWMALPQGCLRCAPVLAPVSAPVRAWRLRFVRLPHECVWHL